MQIRTLRTARDRQLPVFIFFLVLVFPFAMQGQTQSKGSAAPQARRPGFPAAGQIKHVVFIMKENRSFDHYFGLFPGADGTSTGLISTGQSIPLWRAPDVMFHDEDHTWQAAINGMDGGKMDRFDLNNHTNVNGDYEAYTQMTEADIPNYWKYAKNFVLADHAFGSSYSPSYSNHFYSIAADAEGTMSIPLGAHGPTHIWGCDAQADSVQQRLDSGGAIFDAFPCYDPQTMADSFNAAGVSWKYYAPPIGVPGYVFSAYDYVKHIRYSNYWQNNVVNVNDFVSDARHGNLPAVSWVVTGNESEHPPGSTCVGENWTVDQINAVMQGPIEQWNSTVIVLDWDDFGGFYDHYPPKQIDQFGLSLRVPMLIISPYALAGTVSHTTYEHSSVLKFIEEVFGLPSLTARDANANDMMDAFNFNQTPIPPLVLQPHSCPVLQSTEAHYGTVAMGGHRGFDIKLKNYRDVPMTIDSINATGDFQYTGGTCGSTVPAGGHCDLNVKFVPSATGVRKGTLTVRDSDPSSPQTVNLVGLGSDLDLPILYPGLLYSTKEIGTHADQQVQLTNTGSSPVTISQIQMIGDYSETDNCGNGLNGGASCTITVSFAPTATGFRRGNLVIWDSDPASPHTGRLTGAGTALDRNPSSLEFKNKVGHVSKAKSVTLTNTSSVSLYMPVISTGGEFSQTNNCTPSLAAGAQCTISITFSPTKVGVSKGRVTINDSDLTSPQFIDLTGTGT